MVGEACGLLGTRGPGASAINALLQYSSLESASEKKNCWRRRGSRKTPRNLVAQGSLWLIRGEAGGRDVGGGSPAVDQMIRRIIWQSAVSRQSRRAVHPVPG